MPINGVERLLRAGFRHIGHWELDQLIAVRFDHQIPAEPGVYAIVVDGEVKYIGAAQRGLHGRWKKYRSHTNKGKVAVRIRQLIAEALRARANVDVYVVTPPAIIHRWHDLPIDGIGGLEEGLIREMQPLWNRRGVRSVLDEDEA
jgi:hypothetical protein